MGIPLPVLAGLIGGLIALILGVFVTIIIFQYKAQKHDQQYVFFPRTVFIEHNGDEYEIIINLALSRVTVNDNQGEKLFLLDRANRKKVSWTHEGYRQEQMNEFLSAILPKVVNHLARSPYAILVDSIDQELRTPLKTKWGYRHLHPES